VAASHHGDTPYSGNSVTSVPVTPYTTSVDVNGGGRLGRGACGSHDEDHDHDDHWNPPPEYPLLVRWSGGWRTGQVSSNSMCEIQVPPERALRLGVTGPPGGWPVVRFQ